MCRKKHKSIEPQRHKEHQEAKKQKKQQKKQDTQKLSTRKNGCPFLLLLFTSHDGTKSPKFQSIMGGLNSYGNFNNCTVTLTLHMNMWHIVLLIIKIIHTNNQTIEHWYCWHSYIPQIKIKKIEQKKNKKKGHPKIFEKK